jgi:hypothetical protein
LRAGVADAAFVTAEDRLEEHLETLPFAGPVIAKQPSEARIALKSVVQAIDDRVDPITAAECAEEFGVSRDRVEPGEERMKLGQERTEQGGSTVEVFSHRVTRRPRVARKNGLDDGSVLLVRVLDIAAQ